MKKKVSYYLITLAYIRSFHSFYTFLSEREREREMAINCGSLGRNFYHKLPESRRRLGFPARMWVYLKRAAATSVGIYVGKRRGIYRMVRRVVWISLHLKRRVAKMARASRTKRVLKRYDAYSYSQNFDDGRWREEDEEFYRSGSFAFRFVGLPLRTFGFSWRFYKL